MGNALKRFWPLLIFLGLLWLLTRALSLKPHEIPSPLLNQPLPAFSGAVLGDGAPFNPSTLKGKIWLLNVWASWCSACAQEHSALVELAKQGWRIVGLNYKDQPEPAQNWLAEANPYYKVVLDPLGKIGLDLGVYGTPETFLIDQNGIVRAKHVGPITVEVVQQWSQVH